MAKQLTKNKVDRVIKGLEELLIKNSDNTLQNEIILDRTNKLILAIMDGKEEEMNSSSDENILKENKKAPNKSSHIHADYIVSTKREGTKTSPILQEQINKGVVIFSKSDSERADKVR